MTVLGLKTGDPRTDAPNIVKDFANDVKPIIALEHNGFGGMADEHAVEQIERPVGYRMGMGATMITTSE